MPQTYCQTIYLPRQLATNKTINAKTSAPYITQHLRLLLAHLQATEWYSVFRFILRQSQFVKLAGFKNLANAWRKKKA